MGRKKEYEKGGERRQDRCLVNKCLLTTGASYAHFLYLFNFYITYSI